MMERWGDTVGPDEVVNVETLLITHYLLSRNSLFNKEHLRKCELDDHKRNRGPDLTDISDLEHSLIVEGLLCFDNTR